MTVNLRLLADSLPACAALAAAPQAEGVSGSAAGSAGAHGEGMGWAMGCECGYVARGGDEEGLVADARRHAREAHLLELSREQILRSARAGSEGTRPTRSCE
jgi:predicted small metal-binding protein